MVRLVSQKVGKITNEILGVKWLVLFCSSWSDFWLPTWVAKQACSFLKNKISLLSWKLLMQYLCAWLTIGVPISGMGTTPSPIAYAPTSPSSGMCFQNLRNVHETLGIKIAVSVFNSSLTRWLKSKIVTPRTNLYQWTELLLELVFSWYQWEISDRDQSSRKRKNSNFPW